MKLLTLSEIRPLMVGPDTEVGEVIRVIDNDPLQVALVVDGSGKLLGTVTDGDIRRGIMGGIPASHPAREVMNPCPVTLEAGYSSWELEARLARDKINHVPILGGGRVVGLEVRQGFRKTPRRDNLVVIMAGGLGSRLKALTTGCPKPMLEVGGKPILQTILENFIEYGYWRFYLSVNYRAGMIKDYFGDGARLKVEINYLEERRYLGTAGSLSLLPRDIALPVVVMNGDILTKVNFSQLAEFHQENNPGATVCVREYNLQVPYGVVEAECYRVTGINEKPVKKFFVNAGIYILQPRAIGLIPPGTPYDMPQLVNRLVEEGMKVEGFPIREYWIDVGQRDDFDRAAGDYGGVFK